MANLVPSFKQFLPGWVSAQPWYEGTGVPALTPVGFIRIEDPGPYPTDHGSVGVMTCDHGYLAVVRAGL